MNEQLKEQVDKEFSQYLSTDERVKASGFFRKVPSIRMWMLTRGFARFFSKEFLVGVTDQRVLVIPINRVEGKTVYGDALNINTQDIRFGFGWFNDLIVRFRLSDSNHRLKLRFASGPFSDQTDRLHFLKALEEFHSMH